MRTIVYYLYDSRGDFTPVIAQSLTLFYGCKVAEGRDHPFLMAQA